MGMDLKPMRPTKHYPRDSEGKPVWGRYNIRGWYMLQRGLFYAGHPDILLPQTNDGDLIPSKLCKKIADIMEAHPTHFTELPLQDITEWRNCGGFRVY